MPIAHSKLTARAEDVRVENESRCDEPRVVLSHAPRRAPLQQRTTPRVRHLKPLNREALERFHGHGGVSGTFEDFFDRDDGDHKGAVPQVLQRPMSRAEPPFRRFAVEFDEE